MTQAPRTMSRSSANPLWMMSEGYVPLSKERLFSWERCLTKERVRDGEAKRDEMRESEELIGYFRNDE